MKRLTYQEVIDQARQLGYTVTSTQDEYVNANTPINMICDNCGGSIRACLTNLRKMKRCEGNCRPQKLSFVEVAKVFEDAGCELITTEQDYAGVSSKIKYICDCGREDQKNLHCFRIGQRCWECGKVARQGANHPKHGRGDSFKGDKNPNWNPALTDEERAANKNRDTCAEYRKWRRQVHKRDNWTCQKCHTRGGTLNVHHIQNYATCPALRFDISNGITLCEHHHNEFHTKYGKANNTQSQVDEFLK